VQVVSIAQTGIAVGLLVLWGVLTLRRPTQGWARQ